MKRWWLIPVLALGAAVFAAIARPVSAAGDPASATSSAATAPANVHVILLHINDVHGQTQPRSVGGHSVGGYARLATLVDKIRAQNHGAVLLMHAGDELSRGDALTRKTLGSANVEILNRLGLDVFVPGNGDYYDGLDNLLAITRKGRFATLAANVRYKADGRRVFDESTVLQAGPVRIGVLGLSYVKPRDGNSVESLDMLSNIQAARIAASALAGRSDAVVAVSHMGLPEDLMLAEADGAIDLIVGGHTHTKLVDGKLVSSLSGKKVLVVQAEEMLDYCGRVDMDFVAKPSGGYRLTAAKASLVPLDETNPLDPAITALIARLDTAAEPATKPAGRSPRKIASEPALQPAAAGKR